VTEKPALRLKFRDSSSVIVGSGREPAAQDASKPSKSQPPPVGTEALVVKCGHTIAFELYSKDAFRDQRRTKTASRDCSPCRQARVQADMLAAKERRAKKVATFSKALKPRLPDGARFVATYDATQVQWIGALTVEGATYERSGSSLNKLLHKLDDVYRAAKPHPVDAEAVTATSS
jgi:hypothetical protein